MMCIQNTQHKNTPNTTEQTQTMSQEDIATFLSITNADSAEVAKQFLDMAGSNLDTAISLFFEHGSSAAANSTDDPYIPPEENDNDAYRAPDQAVHETLMDTQSTYFPGVTFGGIGGSFGPLRSVNHPRGIFNQDEDYSATHRPYAYDDSDDTSDNHDIHVVDSDSDLDSDDDGDGSDEYTDEDYIEIDEDGEFVEKTRRVKRNANTGGRRGARRRSSNSHNTVTQQDRLAQLFRPPFDMIEKVSLEEAKLEARRLQKWIMVNIQAVEVFQCQTLNRDLWKEPKVKRVIMPNFVFLQYAFDSPAGQSYVNFYSLEKQGTDSLPHIAILDPLTGERLKQWNETPPRVDVFLEEIKEFLGQFSLNPAHKNPVVVQPEEKEQTKAIEELSEESQLEYAIAQSMENAPIHETAHENTTASPVIDKFDQIEAESAPEPANLPGTTTRIQLRLGDGSRSVRRFKVDDPVRAIYQYIKADLPEFHNIRFTIATPQRENLIDKLDETIGDAGLKNSSLLLEKDT